MDDVAKAPPKKRSPSPPSPLTVIVDTREQDPLSFGEGVIVERSCLKTGDYSTPELASTHAIERKSLPDLVGSLTAGRERFMREVERLGALEHGVIVIEATTQDLMARTDLVSRVNPWSVLASCLAITDRGIPVLWLSDRKTAARCIEWMLRRWSEHREHRSKRIQKIEQAARIASGWSG